MNMNVVEASGLGKRYGGTWALRECSLVPDATGVAEPGLPHLQRQVVAKRRLRFVRQLVGRPVQHQPSDREQLVDLVLGEVQVMRDA